MEIFLMKKRNFLSLILLALFVSPTVFVGAMRKPQQSQTFRNIARAFFTKNENSGEFEYKGPYPWAKLAKDAIVIRVPAFEQKGLRCGYHAYINAGILCGVEKAKDLSRLNEGKRFKDRVPRLVKHVMKNRKESGDKSKSEMIDNEEMAALQSEICRKDNNIYRSVLSCYNTALLWMQSHKKRIVKYVCDKFLKHKKLQGKCACGRVAKRFKKEPHKPEVLQYNTGGHWVALRLEYVHGKMVFLLADSLGRKNKNMRIKPLKLLADRLRPKK